jgi:hypothetical protein
VEKGMKVDKIYVKAGSKFTEHIELWASVKCNELIVVADKITENVERYDSLLIFNENQTLTKEIAEVKALFDKQQKAIHKIDINGTLMVGLSNLELWAEQNKCKRLLILGGEELVKNPNLERYLNLQSF